MENKIETLNDFRNRILDIDFNYRTKKRDTEAKLYQRFREVFNIDKETYFDITYDVYGELCLTSYIKLNIHSIEGFKLIREECYMVWNYKKISKCIDPSIEYRYFFSF